MPLDLGSILTAMVTPFDERGRVDEDAAVTLMHHLVEHGSDGVVVCGTTGEAATLDDEEHLGMIELAVSELGPSHTVIDIRSAPGRLLRSAALCRAAS